MFSFPISFLLSIPTPFLCQPLILLQSLCMYLHFHINGIIQDICSFSMAWPLRIIILRFSHVATCINFLLLMLSIIPLCTLWEWVYWQHNHLSMDIWTVSSFSLLQVKMLCTFMYRSVSGHTLSCLNLYRWNSLIYSRCVFNWNIDKLIHCFPSVCTFYTHTSCVWVPTHLHPHWHLIWWSFYFLLLRGILIFDCSFNLHLSNH